MSVFLLVFGNFLGAFSVNQGWVFIALVCLFIIYNMIVVLRFALRTIYVISKTIYIRYIKKKVLNIEPLPKELESKKLNSDEENLGDK